MSFFQTLVSSEPQCQHFNRRKKYELTETQSWVVSSNMTSSRVCQFLSESGGSNFTETAPRPPVPGEENEIQSNGGLSTKSSESHKSNKSCKSGGSNRDITTHSPAATPRRSMKDKSLISNQSCCVDDEDMTAPLGFEPEGSVSNSPPFTENSTPPYMKWAENLSYLLEDRDGVHLFKQFLENEDFKCYSVDFYFACEGLKRKPPDDVANIQSIIRAIHKKYIKTDKLPCISELTRHYIHEKLQKRTFAAGQGIFDKAQMEVEEHMRKNTYPLFLKSDLFVQYIQKEGERSPKSTSTSGSNSVRPVSGPLPTLLEDQELNNVSCCDMDGPPSASKTCVKRVVNEPFNFSYPSVPRVPSIPHTYQSYAPTSLQDSEIQSISSASDALTDDTRSQTDSSIDGDLYKHKRMRRKLRLKAEQNKESNFNQPFIPRTNRPPKDRNIAETDPKAFAEVLIDRLKKVEQKQENDERIRANMSRVLDESDIDNPGNRSMTSSFSQNNNTTSGSVLPLMTSTVIDEENADSILEEHCSRIWESSAQQTPSLSPGRHSPPNTKPKSPDRNKKMQSLPSASRTLHHKKRPDYHSSFDSGMGDEKAIETHRHIHHHHHHHHTKESRCKIESDAQKVYVGNDKGRGSRKHSDTESKFDSGVSMIDSIPSMPNMKDPSSEKVLNWMMDSDRMGGTNTADSDKASSQKRVRSTASSTPAPRKQISKKSGHGASRSTSVDRSAMMSAPPPPGAMPSQPFMQDPSMPILQPTSTTVQLEEAKRRLEESRAVPPVKSKSFGGIPAAKEKKPNTISQGNMKPLPTTRTVPCDLDMSFDTTAVDKKKKSPNSSANTSGSTGEEIVIGYYFCQEPIPYKITVPGHNVTLAQFKHLIGRTGNYRYFFKKKSNEFGEEGAVYEEIKNDSEILPLWDGRIIAKVTKND
ncbi:axin-1-like [Mytilus galloprovincialis]|uniref:axin-1-like n=1 Tax=Mytilus galloprovincialis TaxID=29158 RepID=UPI003F7B7F39